MRARFGTLIDVAIIASAVVIVCAAIVARRVALQPAVSPTARVVVGHPMPPVAGLAYVASDYTLVLILSSSCSCCTESVGTVRELVAASRTASTRMRAVAIGAEDLVSLKSFLRANNVEVDAAYSTRSPADLVARPPRLLLVTRDGIVRHDWVGAGPLARALETVGPIAMNASQ